MYDVIIVGAGHNGLLAGALLGKHGLNTLILEKNDIVGGLITTEEMPGMPGYKFNPGAIVPGMIRDNPAWKELEIEQRFNVEYILPEPNFTFFFPERKYWFLYPDLLGRTADEIERVAGSRDAAAWKKFVERYSPLLELLGSLMYAPCPSLNDLMQLMPELGDDATELVRNILMPMNQLLNEWFDTDYVKGGILKFAGTMGSHAREQGTGLWGTEIFACATMGRPRGGSGEVTRALASAAEAEGVTIRTNAPVAEVLVENGQAVGVRLQDGEIIRSKSVMTAFDPQQVLTKYIDADNLDTTLLRRIKACPSDNASIVVAHLALSELPDFTASYPGIDNKKAVESNMVWCPGMEYNDAWQADQASKRLPRNPVWWAYIPSTLDPSLAPAGKHTLTIEAYCERELKDDSWSTAKEKYADYMIEQLCEMAPNVKSAITGRYVEGPDEIGRRSGTPSGNIYTVDMALNQMFMFRPLPELADGRTPIKNLYLSGEGVHPFGGANGAAGLDSATRFLEDWDAGSITG